MIEVEVIHEGYCDNENCSNYGVVFDAASIDGVVQPIICGVCWQDFRDNCTLK